MESDLELAEFYCLTHQGKPITRVSRVLSQSKRLYCNDCIILADGKTNSALVPLEKILAETAKVLEKVYACKVDGRPPDNLL